MERSPILQGINERYLAHHNIPDVIDALTTALLRDRPADARAYTQRWLTNLKFKLEQRATRCEYATALEYQKQQRHALPHPIRSQFAPSYIAAFLPAINAFTIRGLALNHGVDTSPGTGRPFVWRLQRPRPHQPAHRLTSVSPQSSNTPNDSVTHVGTCAIHTPDDCSLDGSTLIAKDFTPVGRDTSKRPNGSANSRDGPSREGAPVDEGHDPLSGATLPPARAVLPPVRRRTEEGEAAKTEAVDPPPSAVRNRFAPVYGVSPLERARHDAAARKKERDANLPHFNAKGLVSALHQHLQMAAQPQQTPQSQSASTSPSITTHRLLSSLETLGSINPPTGPASLRPNASDPPLTPDHNTAPEVIFAASLGLPAPEAISSAKDSRETELLNLFRSLGTDSDKNELLHSLRHQIVNGTFQSNNNNSTSSENFYQRDRHRLSSSSGGDHRGKASGGGLTTTFLRRRRESRASSFSSGGGTDVGSLTQTQRVAATAATERRRIGVSAEPINMERTQDFVVPVVPKSEDELAALRACVQTCTLFSSFEDAERETVVHAMSPQEFAAGQNVLTQGLPSNDTFYLIISGHTEIIKDRKVVLTLGPSEYFGELELMYHTPSCAATVKCVTRVFTYALQKDIYQHIVLNATLERRKMFVNQINLVEFFALLTEYDRLRLAEALSKRSFAKNDYLIRLGEHSDVMYMILSGRVSVFDRGPHGERSHIIDLGPGEVVGELEFLFQHTAVADVVALDPLVTVAKLSRAHFTLIVGDVVQEMKGLVAAGKYQHYLQHAEEGVRLDVTTAEKRLVSRRRASIAPSALDDEAAQEEAVAVERGGEIVMMVPAAQGSPGSPTGAGVPPMPLSHNGSGPNDGTDSGEVLCRFPVRAMGSDNQILVIVQEDGTIVMWNAAIARLTQFSAADAIGQSIFSFLTSQDQQRALNDMLRTGCKYAGNFTELERMARNSVASMSSAPLTRLKCEFMQATGLYRVNLSISVAPPTVRQPKGHPELLLISGFETRRKVPMASIDNTEWLLSSLKPQLQNIVETATELMRSSDIPSPVGGSPVAKGPQQIAGPSAEGAKKKKVIEVDVKRLAELGVRLRKCRRLLEQHRPGAADDVTEKWHPVSLTVMANTFITELTSEVTQRHNHLDVHVSDEVPTTDVYVDAAGLSDILLELARNCNRNCSHNKIHIEFDVVSAPAGAKQNRAAAPLPSPRGDGCAKPAHQSPTSSTVPLFFPQIGDCNGSESNSGQNHAVSPQARPIPSVQFLGVRRSSTEDAFSPLVDSILASAETPLIALHNVDDDLNVTTSGLDASTQRRGLSQQRLESTFNRTISDMRGAGASYSTITSIATSSAASSQPGHQATRMLQIIVRDDGPGIDAQIIRRVLAAAAAAGGAGSRPLDGRLGKAVADMQQGRLPGLGLLRIANAVAAMAGFFDIRTTTDEVRGTTFSITLPLVAAEVTSPSSPTDGGKTETFTTVLVESNAVQRNVVCQMLWARQHAVLPATSWRDVMRMIEKDSCDILIIDPEAISENSFSAALTSGSAILGPQSEGSPRSAAADMIADPIAALSQFAHRMAIVITSSEFAGLSPQGMLKTADGVIAVSKPCAPAVLHSIVLEAESKMRAIRAEQRRIAEMRQAFEKINRGQLKTLRLLGRGAFGEVHEVEDVLTRGRMAMKSFKVRDQSNADELVKEIQAMTSLKHENIIHYFYCEKVDERNLRIFMELAPGGTLDDRVKSTSGAGLSLEALRPYIRDVLGGLAYIHAHQYVHCDIKPANILLDGDGRCKIGDFGTATHLAPGAVVTALKGTAAYMAPEVIEADETAGIGYDCKADIWSLGVSVLEMATGMPPYFHVEGAKGMGVMKYVTDLKERGEGPDLSPLFSCSPVIFEFVRSCLDPNPATRPSAKELLGFAMVSDGSVAAQAEKILRRAQLLHILNQFVAFKEQEWTSSTEGRSSRSSSHDGRPIEIVPGATRRVSSRTLDPSRQRSIADTSATSNPSVIVSGVDDKALSRMAEASDFFSDEDSDDSDEASESSGPPSSGGGSGAHRPHPIAGADLVTSGSSHFAGESSLSHTNSSSVANTARSHSRRRRLEGSHSPVATVDYGAVFQRTVSGGVALTKRAAVVGGATVPER